MAVMKSILCSPFVFLKKILSILVTFRGAYQRRYYRVFSRMHHIFTSPMTYMVHRDSDKRLQNK